MTEIEAMRAGDVWRGDDGRWWLVESSEQRNDYIAPGATIVFASRSRQIWTAEAFLRRTIRRIFSP